MSAKTGDKVYDTIKEFGISLAKTKMEKMGISWFSTGTSAPVTTGGSSEPSKKPVEQIQPAKEAPRKQAAKQQETIKIGGKKNQVPSYQKKCC